LTNPENCKLLSRIDPVEREREILRSNIVSVQHESDEHLGHTTVPERETNNWRPLSNMLEAAMTNQCCSLNSNLRQRRGEQELIHIENYRIRAHFRCIASYESTDGQKRDMCHRRSCSVYSTRVRVRCNRVTSRFLFKPLPICAQLYHMRFAAGILLSSETGLR
jgi:hypothetical protein